MTGKEKLIEYAKAKKIFRSADATAELKLPRTYISRLERQGVLKRVGYGLYSLAEYQFSETQSILEVAVKAPNGVLCLLSALRFHELTTQNPFEIWLAIQRDSWIPKFDTVPVRIFRFAPGIYGAGIETHVIDGIEVKVYSAAKTIADCFYYHKTVGLDVAIEALRDAWSQRKATMDELFRFAAIRNIKSVMLPYLNTLS